MITGHLDDMAVFAAVVHEGSFTAAARRLGVTKQSVSERVARLEQRLAVQLLVRTTRALRLTDAGERYHEACTAIVRQADLADREARQAQQQAAGTVRVTAPVGLGGALLVPAAREFRRLHPRIHLELVLDESIVDLVRAGIDLALRTGSLESTPSFVARRLFETFSILVASPAYLTEHGRPAHARALEQLPCVVRRRNDTWVIDGERIPVDGVLTVNTFEGAREIALAGIAIALVPAPIVLDDVRAGLLVPLYRTERRITFTALWPSRRLPLRVRLFHDLLVHRAAQLAESIERLAH